MSIPIIHTLSARAGDGSKRPSLVDRNWRHKARLGLFQHALMTVVVTLIVLSLFTFRASAQAAPTGHAAAAKTADYSQESIVIEKLWTKARFENDGTDTSTTSVRVHVQSEAGVQQLGVLTFGYSSDFEEPSVDYVRVHKTDGTVVETPAGNIQDVTSEVSRVAPMYTDYHEKHIAVKALGVGDTLEYQFTSRSRAPLVAGQFWFAYDFDKTNITLDEQVVINVPKDRELKVKSASVKPSVQEEGNRRIYAWKSAHLETDRDEEARRIVPPPAILLSTFKSWAEVGEWWNGLERERLSVTPEVRAKAEELTRGLTTREEKALAIYSYVATRFRYISISLGIGRYQPHAAAEVLSNEYGDCKDKHTLLASLLSAVGIEVDAALMNATRQIDPDVPSPGQFDHVVTALPDPAHGDSITWLDTTAEVAPYGLLLFNLRDKQALLVPGAGHAHLETTPADPPFRTFERYEIDATLGDDGVLVGKVQRTLRGDSEVLIRAAYRQVAKAQWKDLTQRLSQATGFAGEVSEVEAGAPETTTEPYRITYKYTRKDYPDWANHRISPPVGSVGFLELGDKKRTQPFFLAAPQEITAIARVTLPKGYQPKLPRRVDVVRDFAEYHSTYTFKDGVFVTEVREVIKKHEVPVAALDDYRSFQKAADDDLSQFIPLGNGTESAYVPSPSANAEANRLLDQAREAVQRRDLDDAASSAEQAIKLDAYYKDAWLMLGSLRLMQNRTDEGFAALRKAIDLDPEDAQTYRIIAFAYMQMHRTDDAVAAWRQLLKHQPDDHDAHANLGNALLAAKRYREAVPELEAATAGPDPRPSLLLALANAYFGAGNTDKAMPILHRAAEMAASPGIWNDVAYAMAEHRASLPEAQGYAEKAVRAVEDEAAHVEYHRADGLRPGSDGSVSQLLGHTGLGVLSRKPVRQVAKIPGGGLELGTESDHWRAPGPGL